MSDDLGLALQLAYHCIDRTVTPYIGQDFNLQVEAEVHTKINENLKQLECAWEFSGDTIFDYETREFVTTLNGRYRGGGNKPEKPIKVKRRALSAEPTEAGTLD